MAGYTRRAVRGAGIVFIMLVASYFLGYVFRLLIARELGVASYGLVYAIISLFGIFSILMSLGLESALIKYIAQFRVENRLEKIKGSILIVLFSKILLSILVCGALILFSDRLSIDYFNTSGMSITPSEVSLLIKIYAAGIIFSAVTTTLKVSLQGFQSMKYYSSVNFVKSVIVLLVTVFLFSLGFREMAPILGFTLAFIVFLPLIYFPLLVRKVFPEFLRVRAELTKPLAKKLFLFGVPVVFTGLAAIIFGYTDTLILTYFRPLEEVGLYNAAFPTMKIIGVIGTALASVVFPVSSELWARRGGEQLSKGLGMLYKYVLIFVFPIALLMFLFPELILGVLFGGEFRAAGGVLRILALGYFLHALTGVNTSTLSGIGEPKEVSKIMLSGAAVNLVLNLILIPVYGMEGAAFSTLIAFILIFILSVVKIRRRISFVIPWRDFLVVVSSGFLITLLAYLIKCVEWMDMWSKLILTVSLGIFVYVISLLGSGTLSLEEVKGILRRVV